MSPKVDGNGLARFLGWFSLGLGGLELAAPTWLAGTLDLPGGPALVRGYGVREIVAGLLVLARPAGNVGPGARVAGDLVDIATLLPALRRTRPASALVALVMVLGVTALDLRCAGRNRSML